MIISAVDIASSTYKFQG